MTIHRAPLPHLQQKLENYTASSASPADYVVVTRPLKPMDELLMIDYSVTPIFKKSHTAGGTDTKKHLQKQDIGCA